MKRAWLAAFALLTVPAAHAQGNPYYGYPGAFAAPRQAAPFTGTYQAPRRLPERPPVPEAVEQVGPDAVLHQGIDRLKGFLSRGGTPSQEEVLAFLDQEISPFFDFDYMARWAGGSLYTQMDEGERARFAGKLKGLFFSALARNLGAYAAPLPTIDIFPARSRGRGNEVTVIARVVPQAQGAVPARLEFRFYPSREGWKIFDVTANGTSAVAYYRSFFREVARRGSIEACCQ
jgi:phospholipid transport system substrate-binding protein